MIHNENKQAIAVYMKWRYWPGGYGQCYRVTEPWGKTVLINFDSNDASLVVAEMQKRGEWRDFLVWQCFDTEPVEQLLYHIAYLYNAKNFFKAFTEWLKEKK